MKTQAFNIVLPKNLVKQADLAAKKEYRNRSELIREALRIYLEEMEDWGEIFRYGQRQARKVGVKSQKDVDQIVQEFRHGKNKSRT